MEMMDEKDAVPWEPVAVASGMAQANIMAGRLESEGIATKLHYEAAGAIYAITIDGLGEVRILVPAADRERANEVLSRSYDEGDLPWEGQVGDSTGGAGGKER